MMALIYRDIWLAFRSGGGVGLALAFFLIVVMMVPFGVGADMAILGRIAPGVLWIGALLSCLLSLDRIFQLDYEDGSLEALATSPLPFEGIAAAKAAAHWITTGLPLTIASVPLGFLLNLDQSGYVNLILSLGLGTPALSFIGTFAAAVTVGIRRGGLLLSLLVLPLYVPTLIFGAQAVIAGSRGAEGLGPLGLSAGITFLSLAIMPVFAAMALKSNLR